MEHNEFSSIKIGLASPEMIREWSYGEVTKPETINYRTLKAEVGGLFCERIFGPTKDGACMCGKYKNSHSKEVRKCEKCGVDVTTKKVRRERMGHIELAAPVSHIWYFKTIPSRMAHILDMSQKQLEQVLYFAENVVLDSGSTPIPVGTVLSEKQYMEYREMYEDEFRVGMGAAAIKELLSKHFHHILYYNIFLTTIQILLFRYCRVRRFPTHRLCNLQYQKLNENGLAL